MLSSFLCLSSLSQNLPERLLTWAMMFVEKDFHTVANCLAVFQRQNGDDFRGS